MQLVPSALAGGGHCRASGRRRGRARWTRSAQPMPGLPRCGDGRKTYVPAAPRPCKGTVTSPGRAFLTVSRAAVFTSKRIPEATGLALPLRAWSPDPDSSAPQGCGQGGPRGQAPLLRPPAPTPGARSCTPAVREAGLPSCTWSWPRGSARAACEMEAETEASTGLQTPAVSCAWHLAGPPGPEEEEGAWLRGAG